MSIRLKREVEDRTDLPTDCRFVDLLSRASEDPEVSQGSSAKVVRVGPGAKLPMLPTLYAPEKRLRLAEQTDPLEHLERNDSEETACRSNYSWVPALAQKVSTVLDDQAQKWQVIKLTQQTARRRFPLLVVALFFSPTRKDKPGGVITARVFDGTNSITVNRKMTVIAAKRPRGRRGGRGGRNHG